jgi:hypothetical protein
MFIYESTKLRVCQGNILALLFAVAAWPQQLPGTYDLYIDASCLKDYVQAP